ncbi:MAG: VWA domain-containing protein [Chlorobi bacterium]|nr:VWA domain-containing protein [Chlorobiota bacterium]
MKKTINLNQQEISLSRFFAQAMRHLPIVFLLLLFNVSASWSQIIDRDASYTDVISNGTCTIVLAPAVIGEDYSDTIHLLPGITLSSPVDQPICITSGIITITDDTLITMPAGNFCFDENNPDTIEFDVAYEGTDAGGGDVADECTFKIPVIRKPVKVVMVLDISGSMNMFSSDNITRRWDALKTAVELFTHNLTWERVSGDSIGISYFTTDVIQPADPIGNGFYPIIGNEEFPAKDSTVKVIRTDMNNRGPLSMTAMGKGLMDAKNKLATGNPTPRDTTRIVLLFTDGLQNITPLADAGGESVGGSFRLNDEWPASEDSIRYYTIGIEAAGTVPGVLTEIAEKNRGKSMTTITGDSITDIAGFFTDHFVDMLKNQSPQILVRRKGTFQEAEVHLGFALNAGISKMMIQIMHSGDTPTITLSKDGTELPSRIIHGKGYTILQLDFPIDTGMNVLSQGEYVLTMTGNANTTYSVTCLVDDHLLDYQASVPDTAYKTGFPLHLFVKAGYARTPLTDTTVHVKALILKPGDDLGNLLAITPWDVTPADSDVVSPVQQKFFDLLEVDSFYRALLPEEQIIELTNNGDGTFSGSFDSTEISGMYRVVFLLRGEIPGKGIIMREEVRSALVQWGNMDPENTEVTEDIDTVKHYGTITIRPRNKYGYYLGPGFGTKIRLKLTPLKKRIRGQMASAQIQPDTDPGIVESMKDNLDGSYTFFITNISGNTIPAYQFTVMGEPLVSPLPPLPCWKIILLIILAIILILYYLKVIKPLNAYPAWIWWVLFLLWLVLLILEWQGILALF